MYCCFIVIVGETEGRFLFLTRDTLSRCGGAAPRKYFYKKYEAVPGMYQYLEAHMV